MCVCTTFSTSVPLYLSSLSFHPLIHSNSCSVCSSGSKSELHLRFILHLFARRNSTPAAALQSQGNIPVLILPVRPLRCQTQPQILYLLWDRASGLLFRKVCVGRLVTVSAVCCGSVLSLRVQREYKRFWIDILGASLIHRDIYHMGSKGQGGFSSVGSAYICKTLMCL